MIDCLIVDDEPVARNIIRNYCGHLPFLTVAGECGNALEAKEIISAKKIDLLFLDIHMPVLNGIGFLNTLKNTPQVIFTTAYQEYAIDGFDLNAIDYLLKPIPLKRFLQAIDKVMHFFNVNTKDNAIPETDANAKKPVAHFLYLRMERRLIKVNTKDILWIESIKDYIKVVTKDKTLNTKQKISVAEKLLPLGEFIRIHRSFIVPVDKVEQYHPSYLIISGEKIPIGRNYKQACAEKFNPDSGTL